MKDMTNIASTTEPEGDAHSLMYLRARQEWDERVGTAVSAARYWRLACVLSLGVTLVAVLGVVHIGSQSKIVPYGVTLQGDTVLPMSPLSALSEGKLVQLYQQSLRDFVENVRTVYLDVNAQKTLIRKGYAHLLPASPAYNQLTRAFKDRSPFARAETELVKVDVKSVLPLSADTYQVEWEETITNHNGDTLAVKRFKAVANTVVIVPTTQQAIAANPLGFFIKSFSDVEIH